MSTVDSALLVAVAVRAEDYAVRRGLPAGHVMRVGLRARQRSRLTGVLRDRAGAALAVTGVAGSLVDDLLPGDVVVADEVRSARGVRRCPSAPLLAGALRRGGFRVRVGAVVESDRLVDGGERARLARGGALAVDMESARLLEVASSHPAVVVRVIADTPRHPLRHPAVVPAGITALRTLSRLGPMLRQWAEAAGPREIVLAAPRSFCAGVERAVEIVQQLLCHESAPVYVRKQIVHNTRVVGELQARGAVFVDELDEVPAGATVVFSAHGVAPSVRAEADRRGLRVVDATCPLVSKVHSEALRFTASGDTVFLVGHAGHEEVEGTLGEHPGRIVLVQRPEDVAALRVEDPSRVAYLMQTTLAADEAAEVVDALRARFPDLRGPRSDDICYATTNRQAAVREVARNTDLVLVAGSANSSNSRRLAEVAARDGTPAQLVDDVTEIDLRWLVGVHRVGISAGASAPPELVDEIVTALAGLGSAEVREHRSATETVSFGLPKEARFE